ncbi:helix-turn-helix domain-containing protein [Janibacter alkaliphilus]|uniref:helix-turn-helix domain-containing protein n=1 Tax=Janibacter alkaliphilus TaxID=1069963 RepID=UPI003CCDA4A8
MGLGHAVARRRQERGWSIDALADASGVGRRTIMNIESAAKTPRIDTLYAVAKALDTPLAQLVEQL